MRRATGNKTALRHWYLGTRSPLSVIRKFVTIAGATIEIKAVLHLFQHKLILLSMGSITQGISFGDGYP
jgi:hypothetical protein